MLFKDNFKDHKMRLTVKACCYYEQLTGKSFLAFGSPGTTEEDALALLYACFITSNNVTVTLSSFRILYGDEKFAKWANNSFGEAMAMHQQFNLDRDDEPDEEDEEETESTEPADIQKATITNIVAYLVTNSGLSIDYIMNEMQLFEIKAYMKAIDNAEKQRLLEERLWCYLTIAPHIDTKRIKSPQKLLPFEWENNEIKQREMDELRRNKEMAKQIVGMDMFSLFRRPGDDSGQELQSLDIKGSDLTITDKSTGENGGTD